MSEAKHTPGPWHFYTDPQPNGCPIVGVQGLMVAMLAHTVKQPEQRDAALANARLIAAAPELLEALIDAEKKLVELEHMVGGGDGEVYVEAAILNARAAISKATQP